MTWTQLWLIAGRFAKWGQSSTAIWLFVCFPTHFRPIDLFTLRVGDLIKPTRKLPSFALQLHPQELAVTSKVGQFDDGVLLDFPLLSRLPDVMRHVLQLDQRTGSDLMWIFNYHQLLKMFRQVCLD